MREIGSDFWEVPIIDQQNRLFPETIQWYLSGRSALQAIIIELGKEKSISLPSWCCESMIKPFADANYSIRFYPVVFENGELIQKIRMDADVLYLMDYFGYSSSGLTINNYHGIVIRDVTHSIFSSIYSEADYFFGSLRKWCGVWTGGYVWARDGHGLEAGCSNESSYITLRKKAMEEKKAYMEGIREDKGYLEAFDSAEDCLLEAGIAPAADRDVKLAKLLNVEKIKKQRRINAEVLRSAFAEWLLFPELKSTDTPMFVPVLVPDGKRDALRHHLIKHKIYCPVHWPISKYHLLDERTANIYRNGLSLVCDQRYTKEDMYRMVKTIREFMEG